MTGFTLGNISVVGTYYTPEQSLTPRGLLAVTVADTVADGPDSAPYRTVGDPEGLAHLSARIASPNRRPYRLEGRGLLIIVYPELITRLTIRPRPHALRLTA